MRVFDKLRMRFRSLFKRPQVDAELDAELRFHLDQLIEENIASGMPPGLARSTAVRTIGGVAHFEEECRDMRRINFIEGLVQDVCYAFRSLRRAPVFTSVVLATLALGIGGITAVFSVVHAVLLAPLPYDQPGQLVRIYQEERNTFTPDYVTGAHFRQIRDHASSLDEVAALAIYNANLKGLDLVQDGQAQRLRVLRVTSGYFATLRSGRLRGRAFEREDEVGANNIVLSDHLWRTRFHSDPSVIGRTILLSAEPFVIVGIAPAGLKDPIVGEVDAWEPYKLASDTDESDNSLTVIARLRNGMSLTQAHAELAVLSHALDQRWPNLRSNRFIVRPLKDDLVDHSRGALNVLSIAAALVLMAACVNVANLFLVRATGRVREFAIRSALGSGGVRIGRQLLVESTLLATAGGLAGLALGAAILDTLRAMGRDAMPRLGEIGLDPVVLAVTASVTILTGLLFGMAPAVRFGRIPPALALNQQSRSATGGRGQGRLRSGLAVLQVAFALVLLAGAGVLMMSFYRLRQIDFGFRIDGAFTFDLSLPSARYKAPQRAAFQEDLARRMAAIPGVTSAGGTSRLPATGDFHSWRTRILTGPRAGTDFRIEAQQRVISGDFLAALAIPVLAGRAFDARDDASSPPRALVSARFAQQGFPGTPLEQVVGQRIRILNWERQVIGVVGDVKLDAYGAASPTVYQTHRQFAENRNWSLTQVVAAQLPPEQIVAAVRAAVASLDPELVVYRAAPMTEVMGRGVARERFALVLMGAFALVAMVLAAIGLYGVLAYSVRQRTHEIGIRMALGASAADVRSLVLRQAAAVVAIGVAVGIVGALAMGRWISSLVYQTSPRDPRVLVATTLLLMAVALLSAWAPAWRASRVDPRIAMNQE